MHRPLFRNASDPPLTSLAPDVHATTCEMSNTDLKTIMTTFINSNRDRRTLSDIVQDLAVSKEKMRGPKKEMCEFDRRREKGEVIIDQTEGKMIAKEDIINTRVEVGARLVAFQEAYLSTCDKLIALRSECQGLQYKYGGLQDKYLALHDCLLPPRA